MQVDKEEGQKALTHFRELDRVGKRAALLALWPRTGRTHQLRVHCAAIGCPILGDRKYGGEEALLAGVADARRLHLHARRLLLPHPSGKGELTITAEPPHSLSPHCRGIRLLDRRRLSENWAVCAFLGGGWPRSRGYDSAAGDWRRHLGRHPRPFPLSGPARRSRFRKATGRELTAKVPLAVRIGRYPAMVAEGVTLSNAAWGSRPDLARIPKLASHIQPGGASPRRGEDRANPA